MQTDDGSQWATVIGLDTANLSQGGTETSTSQASRDDTFFPPLPDLPDLLALEETEYLPSSAHPSGRKSVSATKSNRLQTKSKGKGKARASEDEADPATPMTPSEDDEDTSQRGISPDPTVRAAKKPRRVRKTKVTKKDTILPELPSLFLDHHTRTESASDMSLDEAELEQRRSVELTRARDPATLRQVQEKLAVQKRLLQQAYNSLNDELVKAQIEQSVLRNMQAIVRDERDRIRASAP